jgi:hypothetical protein
MRDVARVYPSRSLKKSFAVDCCSFESLVSRSSMIAFPPDLFLLVVVRLVVVPNGVPLWTGVMVWGTMARRKPIHPFFFPMRWALIPFGILLLSFVLGDRSLFCISLHVALSMLLPVVGFFGRSDLSNPWCLVPSVCLVCIAQNGLMYA